MAMKRVSFTALPDESGPVSPDRLDLLQDNIEEETATKIDKELANYTGDLNDIKTTGFTYARGTATNLPVSGHFYFLTTIAINENNVYQSATRLIADLKLMYTYERQCVSGAWTEWKNVSAANKVDKTCKTITDWNTATETGFVQTGTGIANGPDGVDYAGGFVLKRGTHILQYAIASRTGVMYTRSSLDGTTWQEWKATSQNITTGTEYETGRIIDGKKEYAKIIDIGTLPNATSNTVEHGLNLSNIKFTAPPTGVASQSSGYTIPLPSISTSAQSWNVAILIEATTIKITTAQNYSAYTGTVELKYTKN